MHIPDTYGAYSLEIRFHSPAILHEYSFLGWFICEPIGRGICLGLSCSAGPPPLLLFLGFENEEGNAVEGGGEDESGGLEWESQRAGEEPGKLPDNERCYNRCLEVLGGPVVDFFSEHQCFSR